MGKNISIRPSRFLKFFGLVLLMLAAATAPESTVANDLPLATRSSLVGFTFDDRPLVLPVQQNFQMALLTASSELGRSCGRMEAYGWRMNQSEQGRVNQIFNTTVDRLRGLGYEVQAQTPSSISRDITMFTADRPGKHFIFMWSAGDIGLVMVLCQSSAPVSATPPVPLSSVQVFPQQQDIMQSTLAPVAEDKKQHYAAVHFTPVGSWYGSYTCEQGYTGATLDITSLHGENFEGTFSFYPTPKNPTVPPGRYTVYGQYDRDSNRILINPGKWLERPKNFYNTVMVGSFDPIARTFSAYFQGITGCTSFEARSAADAYAGISGKFKRHKVVKKKKYRRHIVKKKAVEKKPEKTKAEDAKPAAKETAVQPAVEPAKPEEAAPAGSSAPAAAPAAAAVPAATPSASMPAGIQIPAPTPEPSSAAKSAAPEPAKPATGAPEAVTPASPAAPASTTAPQTSAVPATPAAAPQAPAAVVPASTPAEAVPVSSSKPEAAPASVAPVPSTAPSPPPDKNAMPKPTTSGQAEPEPHARSFMVAAVSGQWVTPYIPPAQQPSVIMPTIPPTPPVPLANPGNRAPMPSGIEPVAPSAQQPQYASPATYAAPTASTAEQLQTVPPPQIAPQPRYAPDTTPLTPQPQYVPDNGRPQGTPP